MVIFIYGLTIFVNILIAIKYRNNKIKKTQPIIFLGSFISMFLLIAGYRNTSGLSNDLFNSELEYINIINGVNSSYEIGYIILMHLGGLFTQDFYVFRSITIGIFLILLFWAIHKWAPSPHYVIALFTAYLIILSAEQFRYFLAFVLFVIALGIFIYSKSKYKKIIFSFFLIVASTIHFSFLIYFVFLFANIKRSSKKEMLLAIFTFITCIIIFINNNQIPGISSLLRLIDDNKIQVYLSQSTNYGFLYPFLLHFISILLTFWGLKLVKKTNNKENASIIENVYKLNLLVVIFFPLFMLQLTFYRLARNMLMINYFIYSQIRIDKEISFSKRKIYTLMVWNSILLWIIVDLFITTSPEALLIPFFTENIYFTISLWRN